MDYCTPLYSTTKIVLSAAFGKIDNAVIVIYEKWRCANYFIAR